MTKAINQRTKEKSKVTKEEWREYTKTVWTIANTSREDHPAVFPEEIPHRLAKLFSFYGETILDPFAGSGTTARAVIPSADAPYALIRMPITSAPSRRNVVSSTTAMARILTRLWQCVPTAAKSTLSRTAPWASWSRARHTGTRLITASAMTISATSQAMAPSLS